MRHFCQFSNTVCTSPVLSYWSQSNAVLCPRRRCFSASASCTDAHREKKEGEEEVVVKESLFAHTRGSKGSMPICTEAVQRLYRGCCSRRRSCCQRRLSNSAFTLLQGGILMRSTTVKLPVGHQITVWMVIDAKNCKSKFDCFHFTRVFFKQWTRF